MSYTYDKVTWTEFTRGLLTTFDLDPIYVILTATEMPEEMLKRWMLAYWCYYSSGPASYIAEQADFYAAMREGFQGGGQYPRGHERRHFRGPAGWEAINCLETFGPPEKVVDYIYDGGSLDYQSVAARAMKFKLFGPWIAWKICDMGERVFCVDVDFSSANLNMYKDPVQGAALYTFGDWQHEIAPDEVNTAVIRALAEYPDMMAPPFLDRPLNVQEIETLFCKFKAHVKGHYPINFDTLEILEALKEWQYHSDLAGDLRKHLPNGSRRYQ